VTQEPESSVVEWGDSSDPFTVELTPTQLRRYVAYPLSAAAAVTAFLSLQLNWLSVEVPADFRFLVPGDREELPMGVVELPVWGIGWIVGVLALTVCTLLTYVGEVGARRHARSVGLATAAALVGLLVAVAVALPRTDPLPAGIVPGPLDVEHELGPGLWLAFGTLGLAAAALWLAAPAPVQAGAGAADDPDTAGSHTVGLTLPWWPGRGRAWRRRQRPPADPPQTGPLNLTVAPAEPFSRDDSG
jgi:hypothetical protein